MQSEYPYSACQEDFYASPAQAGWVILVYETTSSPMKLFQPQCRGNGTVSPKAHHSHTRSLCKPEQCAFPDSWPQHLFGLHKH